MSVISLPERDEVVRRAVDALWSFLEAVESLEELRYERKKSTVKTALEGISDEEVLADLRARKAGAKPDTIHDGKILIAPRNAQVPRDLQVRQSNRLDHRYPAPQAFPKSLRSFAVKLVVKQRPCFDQNVIRGH